MAKPKLSKSARIVVSEILNLSAATVRHVDFVASYADLLLRSLRVRERQAVERELLERHGIDLFGVNGKREVDRLFREYERLTKRALAQRDKYMTANTLGAFDRVHKAWRRTLSARAKVADKIARATGGFADDNDD